MNNYTIEQKMCKYCGKMFVPVNANMAYCSEECRQAGRIRSRKIWEEKTGYKDKERQRKRAAAREQRERRHQEQQKLEEENRKQREAEAEAIRRKRQQEEDARCAAGDLYALMRREEREHGRTAAYWNYFAAIENAWSRSLDKESTYTINDISVLDPKFGDKVVDSIDALGRIVCKRHQE